MRQIKKITVVILVVFVLFVLGWFVKGYIFSPYIYVNFHSFVSVEAAEDLLETYAWHTKLSCNHVDGENDEQYVICESQFYTNPIKLKNILDKLKNNPSIESYSFLNDFPSPPDGEGVRFLN
ncbi:hypothetical protein [Paenibacillus sp. NEAU-GSW1]|uniref:hypothetical protein n=1 Tax=Paenibacillus sp. NEAU-GSW1 TaxID=2682486 RepID=UPI0012E1FB5A|nr:hypothetical protein [Paenibacillus sp. NEAU-GSW1]MUT68789.1 hypothetical protein [Paenibacillus sp. NEAU-GSW1]